jgi:hypothetical protein
MPPAGACSCVMSATRSAAPRRTIAQTWSENARPHRRSAEGGTGVARRTRPR